jgi:hypothetical protein
MKYRFGFHLSNHSFKETDTLYSADHMMKTEPKEHPLPVGDNVKSIHLDKETLELLIQDKVHTGG